MCSVYHFAADTTLIFSKRCLGIRFLYPVYCIAEVEITLAKQTNQDSIQKGMLFCHSVVGYSGV